VSAFQRKVRCYKEVFRRFRAQHGTVVTNPGDELRTTAAGLGQAADPGDQRFFGKGHAPTL